MKDGQWFIRTECHWVVVITQTPSLADANSGLFPGKMLCFFVHSVTEKMGIPTFVYHYCSALLLFIVGLLLFAIQEFLENIILFSLTAVLMRTRILSFILLCQGQTQCLTNC